MRLHRRTAARVLATAGAGIALCAGLVAQAAAAPHAHGDIVHIVKPGLGLNANQSSNWFGYNQGTLEQGGKQFHSTSGNWTVPTATQHDVGQSEASSDWIG